MLDITILAIDKIKKDYFRKGFDEYTKRLKPYTKIEIKELKAESFSATSREKAKSEEAKKILNFLDKFNGTIIALDERGKIFTSIEFAKFLDTVNNPIVFVIGGALGLTDEVKKRADLIISLSAMTFPHELARVMLAEQLYRAVTITKNKTYHY